MNGAHELEIGDYFCQYLKTHKCCEWLLTMSLMNR